MKRMNRKHIWMSLLSLLLVGVLLLPAGAAFAEEADPLTQLTAATIGVLDPDAQSLHLEGVANTWQLGGYTAEDGRKVRQNVLIRGATLFGATDEDLRRLSEEYHLTKIVDFRGPGEIKMKPDPEVAGAKNINISLEDDSKDSSGDSATMMSIMQEYADQPGRADLELIREGLGGPQPDMYVNMITGDVQVNGFRALIDLLLAEDENGVVMYHCSSGKDRTGGFTMVLLTLLGVPKETILADFGLTNVYLQDDIASAIEQAKAYTDDPDELYLCGGNVGVAVKYMELAFDYAEEQAGSMLEFIKQRFEITDDQIEILRNKYLE